MNQVCQEDTKKQNWKSATHFSSCQESAWCTYVISTYIIIKFKKVIFSLQIPSQNNCYFTMCKFKHSTRLYHSTVLCVKGKVIRITNKLSQNGSVMKWHLRVLHSSTCGSVKIQIIRKLQKQYSTCCPKSQHTHTHVESIQALDQEYYCDVDGSSTR